MHTLRSLPAALRKEQRGAVLVEYALLLALILLVCILAITALGDQVGGKYSEVGNSIAAATN